MYTIVLRLETRFIHVIIEYMCAASHTLLLPTPLFDQIHVYIHKSLDTDTSMYIHSYIVHVYSVTHTSTPLLGPTCMYTQQS